jgi:excisionase family DNA binding protein
MWCEKERRFVMTTLTVAAASAAPEALDVFDDFARTLPVGAAREAVEMVTATLRAGRDVIIAGADDGVTPAQAAKVLGVSRAHLYKVLDAGALPFTVVGNRDRRISMSDLRDYVAKAEELRRVTARSAAQTRQTRALAIDEL